MTKNNTNALIEKITEFVGRLPKTSENKGKINKIKRDLESVTRVFTATSKIPASAHIKNDSINLVEILKSMREAMQIRYNNIQPKIQINSQTPEICILGNELTLQDLFLNLIINAIQYGNNSAIINITMTNTYAVIKFYDGGQGFSFTDKEKAFSLYRNPKFSKIPGKGLGLSSARKDARSLGGNIRIEKNSQGKLYPVVYLPQAGIHKTINQQKEYKEKLHDINNLLHLILGRIILLSSLYNEKKIVHLFNLLKTSINPQPTSQNTY